MRIFILQTYSIIVPSYPLLSNLRVMGIEIRPNYLLCTKS